MRKRHFLKKRKHLQVRLGSCRDPPKDSQSELASPQNGCFTGFCFHHEGRGLGRRYPSVNPAECLGSSRYQLTGCTLETAGLTDYFDEGLRKHPFACCVIKNSSFVFV